MKLYLVLLSFLVWSPFLPLAAAEKPKAIAQMIRTGEFHGDEVPAQVSGTWLALETGSKKHDQLRKVRVQAKAVWDAIVDDDMNTKTGKKVTILGNPKVDAFLFRGIPQLRPGPVQTIHGLETLKPNTPLDLKLLSGQAYQLELKCAALEGKGDWQKAAAVLVLRRGTRQQILGTFEAAFEKGTYTGVGNEGEIRVFWAGDINGDGALDFIIDLTDHYNMGLPTLFLGNHGNATELVTKTAQHMTTGC